jgi:hypothetical protein
MILLLSKLTYLEVIEEEAELLSSLPEVVEAGPVSREQGEEEPIFLYGTLVKRRAMV